METIRKRVKRIGKSLTVDLPDNLLTKEYDLIIIPVEEPHIDQSGIKLSPDEFKNFLLNAPVMDDQEYQSIQEKRNDFNTWK